MVIAFVIQNTIYLIHSLIISYAMDDNILNTQSFGIIILLFLSVVLIIAQTGFTLSY